MSLPDGLGCNPDARRWHHHHWRRADDRSSGTLEIIDASNTIGATLDDVQVDNSGTIQVGTAIIDPTLTLDDGTVVSGGRLTIASGDTLVLHDATITGGAAVTNQGLIDVTGTSTIDGGVHLYGGDITIESGQTLTLGDTTGGVTVSGTTISFDGTGDTLNLGQPLSFTAHGFAYGDTLDLAGINPDGVSVSNSGALEIHYGGSTITLAGNYDPASISAVSDGHGGTTITDLTPTVTITDRTTSGLDFHAHNALAEMGSGAIQSVGSSTSFTIVDTADNLKFVLDGSGFLYGSGDGGITVTAGTLTSFHEFTNDTTPVALADFTGLSVDVVTWMADVILDAGGTHGPIDTLTSAYAFNFIGGPGPDSFGSAGHADTLSGTGADVFDGGGAPAGARDILTGGAGSTFMFGQGYGALTITNFDQGNGTFDATEGDQIQLNGLTAPTALQVSYSGGNAILDFGGGDVITLLHVTQDQFEGLGGAEFSSGGNGNNGGNNSGGNSSGPVVNNANNSVTYTGTAVLLDPSITVTDTTGGTVNEVNAWISSSSFQNGDTLTIQGSTGTVGSDGSIDGDIVESGHTIHYHYDNTTSHTIDLTSSTATLADFDAALQLIQFSSTSSDVTAAGTDTSRTITWAAHENHRRDQRHRHHDGQHRAGAQQLYAERRARRHRGVVGRQFQRQQQVGDGFLLAGAGLRRRR